MIRNYKESLIEPLDKEELHIFHSNNLLDGCIKEIFDIIQGKIHGSYLIGGVRGVGKTSLVNLCCAKYKYKDLLRINLNCNKMISVDNFLYHFIEELRKSALASDLPDEEIDEINNIAMKIINNYSSKITHLYENKKNNSKSYEENNEEEIDIKFNIFKEIVNYNNKMGHKSSKSIQNEKNKMLSNIEELEERNDQFILVEKLSNVLRKIALCENKYRIIITVDELDKHNEKFIEELFDYYKNLFLNSHLITFFIVDTLTFINICNEDEIESKLLSYFIKKIYIPTLEHKDVKNYMYREFEIESYKNIIKIDYLTCGIFRKMNTYNYLEGYNSSYTLAKAIIYHELMHTELQYNFIEDKYIYDVYKFSIKELIKFLFSKKKITSDYIYKYLEDKEEKYNISIDQSSFVISKLDYLAQEYNFLNVINLEGVKKYMLDLNNLEEYKIEDNLKAKDMQFNLYYTDSYNINRYIDKGKLVPIIITERRTEAFLYIIRFIETMPKSIHNVIIVKKISNWNEAEVTVYSAILILYKPIGNIAYIIEECSFSYENPFTVDKLIAFMEKSKIKIIKVETDDEPVEKNLKYILNKAEEVIYKDGDES